MSTTVIDERVVEMRFNNADFEKNVAQSMSTLGKLKEALNFDSVKSLNELSKAGNNVSLDGIGSAVETVQAKFSALQVIGMTALSEITKAAISAGSSMVKSLISPITQGGMTRALNIEQAKFQLKGLGVAWEKVGDDINYAVDGTAYGLDVAAKAAAQLSASNVALGDDMKAALRGISGVAAMTGASYEEISRIFTTVAGNGRAMNGELNRIGERGLNAGAAIAKYFNGVNDGTVEATESVKASVKSITKGLNVTEADIKEFAKKGVINFELFSKAMDTAFGEHAKDANSTFTGALSNMKAALARIGAEFATPYMESMKNVYNSARKVFNSIKADLGPVIKDYKYFLSIIEKGIVGILDSKQFNNGIGNIIDALRQSFWNLLLVLDPIRQAFAEIFPIDLLGNFEKFTKKLATFVKKLQITNKDASNLKDTFSGIFSIFKLVGTVVTSVLKALITVLFPAIQTGNSFLSTVLAITGAIGRFITGVSDLIIKSNVLQNVIQGIGTVISTVLKIASIPILLLLTGIASLINLVQKLVAEFKKYDEETQIVARVTETFYNVISGLGKALGTIAEIILTGIVVAIYSLITGISKLVTKVKEFVTQSKTLQTILSFIKEIGWKFLNFITDLLMNLAQANPKFYEFGKSMFAAFDQMEKGTGILEKLGGALKFAGGVVVVLGATIANALYEAGKAVVAFVKSVIINFDELGGKTQTIAGNIGRVFKAIGTSIGNFIKNTGLSDFLKKFKSDNKDSIGFLEKFKEALHNFFEEFTLGHAIALAFVGVMTAVGLAFIKLSKQIGSAFGSIGDLFSDIRNKLFGKKANMIDNFKNLAISIALVAGSLALLASVDQNKLKSATILIASLIGGLTVLVGIMTAVSVILQKKGLSTNMTKYARAILEMSIAVGILAAALYTLQSVNIDGDNLVNMLTKIGIVLGTMLGLVGIITVLSKAAPGFTKGSISIVAAALALILVAETLKGLQGIKFDDVQDGLIAAGAMFVGLGVVMKLGSDFSLANGAGLLLACIGINKLLPTLVKTMQEVANADLSGLKAKILNNKALIIVGIAALGAILLTLGKAAPAFQAVGKILLSMAILSVSLAVSLAIVSKVFKDLTVFFEDTKRDADAWKKASGALTIMVGVLGLFSILFAAFAKLKIDNAVSKLLSFSVFLIAFSASLVILTKVMQQVADLSWPQILKGGVVIGGLAVIISAMMIACGKAQKVNAKTLITLMVSITVLMGELIVLSMIPYEKLLAAMIAMSGVMFGVAAVINAISDMDTEHSFKKIATLLVVTGSMILLGQTLSHLAQFDWQSIAAAGGAMLASMIGIKLVLDSLDGLKVDPTALAALAIVTVDFIAVGASLALAAQNDWQSIAAAGGAMLAAMLGIKIVIDAIDGVKVNKNTLKALALVAVDLIAVGASLYFVSQQPWQSIVAAGAAMFAAMTSIGIVIKLISDLRVNKNALVAMTIAIGDILAIGVALYLVAQQPWQSIIAAGGMLTLALLAVSGAIAIVGSIGGMNAITASAAIVAVSASLVILAAALKMFEAIDPEALKKAGIAFGVLVGVLAVLAGISALTGGIFGVALLGIAAAMVAVGIAAVTFGAGVKLAAEGMNLMIPAIQAMAGMDLDKIAIGLGELALGLAAVSAAGLTSAAGGLGMIVTATGIAALGVALMAANPAMDKFQKMDFTKTATSLAILAVSGLALIPASVGLTTAGAAMLVLAAGLGVASVALAAFNSAVKGFINTLGLASGSAGKAASNIVASVKKPFDGLLTSIKKFVSDFKSALSLCWSSSEKEASSGGSKIAKALLKPFHTILGWNSPPQFLVDLFNDMSKAISSGGDKAEGSATGAGTGIANSLKSSITNGLSGFSLEGILGDLFKGLNLQIDLSALGVSKYTSIKQKYNVTTKEGIQYSKEEAKYQKDLEAAQKGATDAAEKETESLDALTASLGKSGGAAKETAKDFTTSLTETISNQLDMFTKFELKAEVTAEQMLENMRSNLTGFAQWSAELAGLAERGIDQSLYQKLAEMGPNCYETVHAFSTMTDEQLQQANDMWQQSITLPDSAAKIVGDGYDKAGKGAVTGLTNALTGGIAQVQDAGAKAGQAAVDGVTSAEGLDEHSPSKKTFLAGQNAITGLNNGMKGMTSFVRGTASAIGRFIVSDFNTNMAPAYFINIGKNAMNGLASGMTEMEETVFKAAYNVGAQAMEGLKKGLDENKWKPLELAESIANSIATKIAKALEVESPSKVMIAIGGFVAEGLAIGMDKGADKVYSSAERLATVTEQGVESMEGRIQDLLSESLDLNPVITPRLDLSYMRAQLASVNDMFNERTLAAAYAGQNGGISSGSGNAQINFTQNNYSPKALNRYEIYRNTKNQVSQLKGALA